MRAEKARQLTAEQIGRKILSMRPGDAWITTIDGVRIVVNADVNKIVGKSPTLVIVDEMMERSDG